MNNEPSAISEARTLLEDFEKSEGVTKKHFFEDAITVLQEFLDENPESAFSKIASNLINIYTTKLLAKLGTTPFSNLNDWAMTLIWTLNYKKEIEKVIGENPDLKDVYNKFTRQQPWKDELLKLIKQL